METLGRGGGDGFCLDVEGNYYCAATVDHGVRIVDPSGNELDFLALDGDGVTTNCCFGGADGRTLFATDAIPGRVVAWEGLPHPGLPLHAWPDRLTRSEGRLATFRSASTGVNPAGGGPPRRGRAPTPAGRPAASPGRAGRSTRR